MAKNGCCLRVVNWEKHQHYRNRTPPWIKFHNSLLEDPVVAALPDTAKAHLFGIWLLASRSQNSIPGDAAFIGKRINATTKVDVSLLIRMGFLDWACGCAQHASAPLATCSTEKEKETEESRGEQRQRLKPKALTEGLDSQANRALIDLYNATFGTRITYTPGNLKAAQRARDEGYTLEQCSTVFQAVKAGSTASATWCRKNNLEFEYLVRPAYMKSGNRIPARIDQILNELATGRPA